jgi:translation initiation factor IF-3
MNLPKALELAREQELDLVEISPTANPPVCKILDFGKYKYEQTKKERKAKKGQKIGLLKEVRFRPKIEEHDLQSKIKKVKEFIEDGSKVRIVVRFRGREIVYPELGWKVLRKVAEALVGKVTVSNEIVRNARNIALTLSPATSKKSREDKSDAKT